MTYFFFYVILNAVKNPTEEVRRICFDAWVVGYFACAQYDVLFLLHVILNDSEGSRRRTDRHMLSTLVVGYFARAQYDVICFERKPKKLLYYLVKRRNFVFFDRFL